ELRAAKGIVSPTTTIKTPAILPAAPAYQAKLIDKTCCQCGKSYQTRSPRSKYCSQRCNVDAYKDRHPEQRRAKDPAPLATIDPHVDLCPFQGHRIEAVCGHDLTTQILQPLMDPWG
ncbi:MAG: hypothetical protein HQK82_13115, partial [Desulfovibrionaceae bacterium]|nr:hypothetical protein [Desulfovibrionaceae bacterium]